MAKNNKNTEQQKQNQQNAEANKFDKIIKENILPSVVSLVNITLKLDIDQKNLLDIPEQIQTTIEREPDVLKLVNFPENTQNNFILHIEFQTYNNIEMHKRMMEYYAILHRKHNIPLLQFVIYVGVDKMDMKNKIQHSDISFRYNLFDMGKVNYDEFLDSDIPEVVMLGVLAGFGKENKEEAMEKIIEKMITLSQTLPRYKNTNAKEKFITQIRVLSKIKKLNHFISPILKKMALLFNIEEDEFYQEGVKKEREKANLEIEKTLERANLEKKLEKEKTILKVYVKGMKIHDIAESFDVSIQEVKKIIKNAK